MLLGAHMSINGGLDKAVLRGKKAGCDVIQIFTKNSNSWTAKPLSDDDRIKFEKAQSDTGVRCVAAHTSYLINCASPKRDTYEKSLSGLADELKRAEFLNIPYLVLHPGAHTGAGEYAGIKNIVKCVDKVFSEVKPQKSMIALEITAGQGTSIGSKFEHMADIMALSSYGDKLVVCFDTCHAFAAGYDLKSKGGYEKTFSDFGSIVGIDKLKLFHINDSKRELSSKIDRHEHIGKGHIGKDGFRLLMKDDRFSGIPMILETPKGEDLAEDIENLSLLRKLSK